MYVTNVTKDYENITFSNYTDYDSKTSSNYTDYDNITFTNCTNNENKDLNIIFKYLLLSIPSSILLFSLIFLMIYTLIKPLINNKW